MNTYPGDEPMNTMLLAAITFFAGADLFLYLGVQTLRYLR